MAQKLGENRKERIRTSFGNTRMANIVAAIDLGDSKSVTTVLSTSGDVADSFTFTMNDEGYSSFAQRVPTNARVAFEATGMAYPVFRALKRLGYEDITVAHPEDLVWIVKSKKKNDRVDSLKIAKLHMAGMLPESHLLTKEEQISRDLLIQRVKLGVEISRIKNSITSYLKREDVYQTLPKTSSNFSDKRRLIIKEFRFKDERDLILKTMMDRLEFLENQCTPLESEIKRIARESDDVRLLMTIPGIDFYLASLLSSYIGDINRFPSEAHLASFFGIIPISRDSAETKRRGRMSKEGPAIGRWALSIMVDTVTRYNKYMKSYYISVKKRTGSGNLAHVSTSRKMLRMIDHMLRTREHWKWENQLLTERKMSNLGGA
jgi:transposase